MTRHVPRVFVAIAAALALTLTACAVPESTESAKPEAQQGGDIRFHLYQAPTSFNPFVALNGADGQLAGLHFRSMVRVESNSFVPGMAESWTANDDATEFTFELQDTKWSDGEPFTVDDVIYSYETYVDPATASPYAGQLSLVAGVAEFTAGTADSIAGLTAVDDHTLKIELTQPNAAFLGNLSALYFVPEHVYGSIDRAALNGNALFREPTVGLGPYVFSKWVTDDQIALVPNEESLEAHPLDHIYAQYLTGDVARAQLETGEIDIAQVAATDKADLDLMDTVDVHLQAGTNVVSLFSALDSGKFADPRLRQAILYAINRDAIVENVLAGNGAVPQSMMFAPEWTMPKDGLIEYAYDPEKAKELLEEAGWDPATPVSIEIVPGTADRDAVVDIVAGQLKEVGINAEIKPLQPAELSSAVANRTFDLLISTIGYVTSEPGLLNTRFLCDAALNTAKYCNPELDEILKAAVATSDQDARVELYQEAQKILNAEPPAIPLYVPNTVWGSTVRVQGFDPSVGTLTNAQKWSVSD